MDFKVLGSELAVEFRSYSYGLILFVLTSNAQWGLWNYLCWGLGFMVIYELFVRLVWMLGESVTSKKIPIKGKHLDEFTFYDYCTLTPVFG